MEKDIRIVFMGTPEFASNVLKGLVENNYNIVGVVSQPDKEVGRKRILTPSPVKEMALNYGLKVLTPYKIRKEYEEVLSLEPDLIITCAYGQIIPKALLEYPKYKCINKIRFKKSNSRFTNVNNQQSSNCINNSNINFRFY